MVVVCVISIECRVISFFLCAVKLCYVYGKHLRFAGGGFQILGFLQRNDKKYAQGKAHCLFLPLLRISLSPIFFKLSIASVKNLIWLPACITK